MAHLIWISLDLKDSLCLFPFVCGTIEKRFFPYWGKRDEVGVVDQKP